MYKIYSCCLLTKSVSLDGSQICSSLYISYIFNRPGLWPWYCRIRGHKFCHHFCMGFSADSQPLVEAYWTNLFRTNISLYCVDEPKQLRKSDMPEKLHHGHSHFDGISAHSKVKTIRGFLNVCPGLMSLYGCCVDESAWVTSTRRYTGLTLFMAMILIQPNSYISDEPWTTFEILFSLGIVSTGFRTHLFSCSISARSTSTLLRRRSRPYLVFTPHGSKITKIFDFQLVNNKSQFFAERNTIAWSRN